MSRKGLSFGMRLLNREISFLTYNKNNYFQIFSNDVFKDLKLHLLLIQKPRRLQIYDD